MKMITAIIKPFKLDDVREARELLRRLRALEHLEKLFEVDRCGAVLVDLADHRRDLVARHR